MVSYSKTSVLLFLASTVGGADAHRPTKNFDAQKFAAHMKDLRLNGPGSENYASRMLQKGSEEGGMLRGSAELEQKRKGKKKKGKGKDSSQKGGKKKGGKKKKGSSKSKGDGSVTSEYGNIVPGCTTSADCFLDGHEFRGQQPGDSRGPCPFINVMANHGFLNRNGIDTVAFNIPLLAEILFDLPKTDFDPVVNLAVFDGQAIPNEDGEVLMDIERLWDRPGEERDLSQIFPNPGIKFTDANMFGVPPTGPFPVGTDALFLDFRYTINEGQLVDLLARTTADGMLTVGIHNEFLMDRMEDSLNGLDKDAPENCQGVVDGVEGLTAEEREACSDFASSYFRFSEEDTHVTANQFIFPTFILGEDANDFTFVPAGHIEGLWREFRFPEGYAPRSVRHQDAFSMECYTAERERLQTINEWTIKRRLMRDNMEKAGVSEESIVKIEAETFLDTNPAVAQEFKDCPDRARLCDPLPGTERNPTCLPCEDFPIAGIATPSVCPCENFRPGEEPDRCEDSEGAIASPELAVA